MKRKYIFLVIIILLCNSIIFSDTTSDTDNLNSIVINETKTVSAPAFIPKKLIPLAEMKLFKYPLWRIITIILILLLGFIVNTILRFYLSVITKKFETEKDNTKPVFIYKIINSLRRPINILIWAGIVGITGPILLDQHISTAIWISKVLLNIALVVFIWDFVIVIEYYLTGYADKTKSKLDDMLIPILKNTIRIVVLIIVGLQLYQSISGQSITTILAGFGIVGMAVALAGQETIKNLFGFAMIVFDKPFQIGDRIDFEGHDGVIEEVGLRSLKLRRLDGHLVTIPNSKIADNVVHNIAKRPNIRRIMNIGITYDTPIKKVEKAVEIVKKILDNHEGMKEELPPRVYFDDFKSDYLNIIAIYWYHPPDYWKYMEHCEWVNLEIMKAFEKEGIEFAFPTQTLYLAGDPNRELNVNIKNSPTKKNKQ